MRCIHFILLALLAIGGRSQAFIEFYDAAIVDRFTGGSATSDGGYILCGRQSGAAGFQAWVLKVDENGTVDWSQLVAGMDIASDVVEVDGGGYLMTGGMWTYDAGDSLSIVRLDASGGMIWHERYAPALPRNLGIRVIPTDDGGYLISGRTGLGGSQYDVLLLKIDQDGQMEWHQQIDLGALDEALCIVPHPDGGFLVLATRSVDGIYYEPILMHADVQGDTLWTMSMAGTNLEMAHDMILTSENLLLFTGITTPVLGMPKDVWVKFTDMDGTTIWSNSFGDPGTNEIAYRALELPGEGFVLAVNDGMVGWMKIDEQGDLVDQDGIVIGAAALDLVGIWQAADGGYAMAGNVISATDTSNISQPTDAYLLQTSPGGVMNVVVTDLIEMFVYPNPATEQLFIRSSEDGPMDLVILDIQGRPIRSLDRYTPREISVDDLMAGTYFLGLTSTRGRKVMRFVVER